jgi:two pore calcium channel protein
LLFAILDKDGSSTITEEEFMDFGNVILLEFINNDVYTSVVEAYFPNIYASRWYQTLAKAVKSDSFEMAIDAILFVNAIVIAIQSYPELSNMSVEIDPKYWDGSIDTIWEIVETIFTAIYGVEAIVKIVVLSWRRYIESSRNVFDFTITVLAIISSIIVYYPNEFSDSRIIRMIVMARVLRLVRLLSAIKRFQAIATISAEILPDAVPVIALLFLIMYMFAVLGVHLYGGYITRDPSNRLASLVLNTDFSE